jgi:hypothetical protein
VTSPVEQVLYLFNYHDGPKRGLAKGEGRACYFDAPFRDDLDDYDSVFNVMYLRDPEVLEVVRLFSDARLTDPMFRDPARRALEAEISSRFDALMESGSPEVQRRKASFQRHGSGGVRGSYSVTWDEPNN